MTRNEPPAEATERSEFTFSIALPGGFRWKEVLDFHDRDPLGVAEQTSGESMHKGLIVRGRPAALDVALREKRADCRLCVDGSISPHEALGAARSVARKMLGLIVEPQGFEALATEDPLLGSVVKRQRGLRVPQAATPFEALTWAILGQQVHLAFAITLRRTLLYLAGRRHSSGLWCYPEPSDVARLDPEELGRRKFSRAKAEAVVRVARLVEKGGLSLGESAKRDPVELEASLVAVKGVGPWTAHYTMLRGFGVEDCSLHGDAAVRKALGRLLGGDARPSASEAQRLLERYRPHRSMAAAHLWASLQSQ